MIDINQIREHAEVVGSDGGHIGTVDHVDGNRLKLTKSDNSAFGHGGHHHYIEASQIDRIDGNRVCLNVAAADLRQLETADAGGTAGGMGGASTASGQRYSGGPGYGDQGPSGQGGGGIDADVDGGRGTGVDDINRDSAGRGNYAGGTPGGINTGAQNMSGTMGADGTAGIGGGALGEGTSGGLGTGRDRGF